MPLYEYECKACGHRFENIQKFSDPLITLCPKCGEAAVEQMISAPAFQFKGSGWYVSDYPHPKAGGAAAGSDPASAGTDARPEHGKKSESTKAETKSESAPPSSSTAEAAEKK